MKNLQGSDFLSVRWRFFYLQYYKWNGVLIQWLGICQSCRNTVVELADLNILLQHKIGILIQNLFCIRQFCDKRYFRVLFDSTEKRSGGFSETENSCIGCISEFGTICHILLCYVQKDMQQTPADSCISHFFCFQQITEAVKADKCIQMIDNAVRQSR